MSEKPISRMGVSGVSVTVEMAELDYGSGEKNAITITSRLPNTAEGLPLDMDTVIGDGLDKYFAAWQTIMQAMLASRRIDEADYVEQTKRFLARIKKVRALYGRIAENAI